MADSVTINETTQIIQVVASSPDQVIVSPNETSITVTEVQGETVTITEPVVQVVQIQSSGSLALQTLDGFTTDDLPEGASRLYFTNARASAAAPVQSVTMPSGYTVTDISGDLTVSVTNASNARAGIGADNAANLTTGDLPAARVSQIDITALKDVSSTLDKTAQNILYTTGSIVAARNPSNWSLTDFTNDLTSGDLPAHTHAATDVTSGTFADARISQTSVTQHEAALAIAASQLTSGSLSIDLIPDTDQTYNLGSADFRWADIHGDLDGPVTFRAKISGGGTLAVGDVVYIDGVNGEVPTVAKASASNASTMPAFGIVSQGGSGSQDIHITTLGSLTGIALPTPTYTLGDNVYVSTTAGQFTTTPPTGESNLIQNIGYVAKTHVTNGILKVGGAGRTNAVPNLNSGNIFYGNGSNQAVSTALSTAAADINIGDLGNVTTGLLSDNMFLAYSTGATAFTGRAPAAARTALGLGTAATLNVGTSANNIVQLNGSAQLPAVDGSLLTGVSSTDWVRGHPDTTIARYFEDFNHEGTHQSGSPRQVNGGTLAGSGWTWYSTCSSSTITNYGRDDDAYGIVAFVNESGAYDRGTFYTHPQNMRYAPANNDELFCEARVKHIFNPSATLQYVALAIGSPAQNDNQQTTTLGYGYSNISKAGIVAQAGKTYLRSYVKNNWGTGGSTTDTDLTSYTLPADNTWYILGAHAKYDSANTRWVVNLYYNQTLVATEYITDWGTPIHAGLIFYNNSNALSWSGAIDWINTQHNVYQTPSYTNLEDL